MTETVLDRILATKRAEVAEAKAARALGELLAVAHAAPPPRPFRAALEAKVQAGGFALIAEIKRASPSKGLIRADFDPPALARAYAEGGAGALSILTDGPYFQGAPDFLVAAREAVGLPCLRKDFMIDPYQVVESRAMGADAILVIMAAVDDDLAQELTDAAHALGMDVLAEVHNGRELDRALALEPDLLGINNRDLKTFETTLEVTERLAPFVPDGTPVVTESGIASHADLVRLAAVGVEMCLVGESLMRQDDVATATRSLLGG